MDIRQTRQRTETNASDEAAPHQRPLRMLAGLFLARIRSWFAPPAHEGPIISCSDPEEAYLQACIASPPFCYISPALYGLGPTAGERRVVSLETRLSDEA